MTWPERLVQDHKRRTDCAIHGAFSRLASDPLTLETFQQILSSARERAVRLFDAPVIDGRHLGVEALIHLSRFRENHIRPAVEWAGTPASWRLAVSSLARHLICIYDVPMFLSSAWYATDTSADIKRRWVVAHSRGESFRSLDVPIMMTRRMEHVFLASQNHLLIEHAMRRAELIGLGASAPVVKAVMATRLAGELQDGEFWRTVWLFLIANADEIHKTQIGPLIDYVQAVRHDRMQGAMMEFGAPQAAFSMKGRTVQSMLRLMEEWHRSLGGASSSLTWGRSSFEPLVVEERESAELPTRWHMVELVNGAQLRREGAALHHCVASYADRCHRGASSIWSLRMWRGEKVHHVLTVEVDPRKRTVVQARGLCNRAASGKSLRLLQDWAVRERLRMSL